MHVYMYYIIYCDHILVSADSNPSLFDGRIFSTSSSYTTGLVQLYYNSQWLPVCDDGWGKQEGSVFCKQLSFPSFVNTYPNTVFSDPLINQTLSGVTCTGEESSISDCDVSNVNVESSTECNSHKMAIVCSGMFHLILSMFQLIM